MIVSHLDSETRSGFMAVLSPRFTELAEALRQTLSSMDFAFALKVGCLLFDRHAPEGVMIAGLVAPFVDRLNDTILIRLTDDERHWVDETTLALMDASRVPKAMPLVQDVVLAIVETHLKEKLNARQASEREGNSRTMLLTFELDAFRRAFINYPHYASFETLLRAWATKEEWDPVWIWATRPIYQITVKNPSGALDDLMNVLAMTGFYYRREVERLLVRALPTKQALLDRLMVSVAARHPEWQVDLTTEFPKEPEAWQHWSLTIDMKLAIYRRIALGDVKDLDPYPKMLKIMGLSC